MIITCRHDGVHSCFCDEYGSIQYDVVVRIGCPPFLEEKLNNLVELVRMVAKLKVFNSVKCIHEIL